MAPCVIFLDEVDSLFAARGARSAYTTKREALNEFMMEWDGCVGHDALNAQGNSHLFCIATGKYECKYVVHDGDVLQIKIAQWPSDSDGGDESAI